MKISVGSVLLLYVFFVAKEVEYDFLGIAKSQYPIYGNKLILAKNGLKTSFTVCKTTTITNHVRE